MNQFAGNTISSNWIDKFGIIASTICILHCLMVPFIGFFFLLTMPGEGDFLSHLIFGILAFISIGISSIKNYPCHKSGKLITLGMSGALILCFTVFNHFFHHHEHENIVHDSNFFLPAEEITTIVGSMMIILYHYLSLKKMRATRKVISWVCLVDNPHKNKANLIKGSKFEFTPLFFYRCNFGFVAGFWPAGYRYPSKAQWKY